ncbi:hypothetical protein ACP275_06G156400 [Erythranthe tilingii]
MSAADLEFFTALPIIKTVSSDVTADVTDDCQSCCVSSTNDDEADCRTPKSPENMIPPILVCPPAPRKPLRQRTTAASSKRKLCELQFFEIAAREEVESFFRRVEESINGGAAATAKRRCVM